MIAATFGERRFRRSRESQWLTTSLDNKRYSLQVGLDFASGSVIQIPPSHPFPLVDMGFHRTGGDFLVTRLILKTIKEKKSFKISSSYPLHKLNLKICLLRNEQISTRLITKPYMPIYYWFISYVANRFFYFCHKNLKVNKPTYVLNGQFFNIWLLRFYDLSEDLNIWPFIV